MRDWYQKIIKLDQALPLITANNRVVIGVAEDQIEYEVLSTPFLGLNYKAKSKGLYKLIIAAQKSSSIEFPAAGMPVTANIPITTGDTHATSVSGIVLGNKFEFDAPTVELPIRGVIEDAELINIDQSDLDILVACINDLKYYVNNGIYIDPAFNGSTRIRTFENSSYVPPNKMANVINASFSVAMTPARIANYAVLFNTMKTYGNNGRGIPFIAAAGNSGTTDTEIAQPFGKHFKYPLIVSAATINDEKIFNELKEFRSNYSSYGDRVDICAPSNAQTNQPDSDKSSMYTTTNENCGELGTHDEVISKIVTNQSNNGNLTLNNVDQIFAGNCIELGSPSDMHHEILTIKEVDRPNKKIIFSSPRYYTATPFTIGTNVNIAILKTAATISGTAKNQLTVTNNRCFGYIGQEVCIYNGITHAYVTIFAINGTNQFEFNPVLDPAYDITVPIIAIPGQVIATPTSYTISGSNTIFTFPVTYSNAILTSFFKGGLVEVSSSTGALSKRHVSEINLADVGGTKTITLQKYNLGAGYTSLELKTIGYGSYTSSFGGTSAASPVVAGVAGLLVRANSDLNVLEIKNILKTTADKIALDQGYSSNSDPVDGKWKDSAGNNINFTGASANLTAPTVIGSNQVQVDNASIFSINDAVKISSFRSVIDRISGNTLTLQLELTSVYSNGANVTKATTVPIKSKYYGTGRVNAKRAVILANTWHSLTPSVPVVKPTLAIADKVNTTTGAIENVLINEPVDSPDIWIKEFADTSPDLPSTTNPYNTVNISNDQKIYIKTRNLGNAESYSESDLRIFVSFTDDVNPPFKFPEKWFHEPDNIANDNTILLAVKSLDTIAATSTNIMALDWKAFYNKWKDWNPLNKRTYINVHLAPFDGVSNDVQKENIRLNKQLSSKEIIISAYRLKAPGVGYVGSYELTIPAGSGNDKSFEVEMLNIKSILLDTIKLEVTKTGGTTEVVLFSKDTNTNIWGIEGGLTPTWITFGTPIIAANTIHTDYSNATFPHVIHVSPEIVDVKFKIINV